MTLQFAFHFQDQQASQDFAAQLWQLCSPLAQRRCVNFYLLGNLGAGKSTFSRAFIQASGYQGNIPSPTYSIQEDYQLANDLTLYHCDLYRIADPYELDAIGFFDNQQAKTIFLIEWPQILLHDYPCLFLMHWDYVTAQPNARSLKLTVNEKLLTPEELLELKQALTYLSQQYK